MGRKPMGDRAMTPAEKMRRYRAKKFGNKVPVTEPDAAGGNGNAAPVTKPANGNAPGVTESDLLAAMPKTTREKMEAWKRRVEKGIEAEIEARVRAGIAKHLEEVVYPKYREKEARAEEVIASHKGVITKAEFRALQMCLHPDRRATLDEAKFNEAFILLEKHKAVLVKPEVAPRVFTNPLPKTAAEFEALRKKPRR